LIALIIRQIGLINGQIGQVRPGGRRNQGCDNNLEFRLEGATLVRHVPSHRVGGGLSCSQYQRLTDYPEDGKELRDVEPSWATVIYWRVAVTRITEAKPLPKRFPMRKD